MNFLIDTHTFLWYLMKPENLSASARKLISDSTNEIHISYVSFWELSLKYSLGKLELYDIKPEDFPKLSVRFDLKRIAISENDVTTFHQLLPALHKDPFDRMIAWQAITRNLTLLSKDHRLKVYEAVGLRIAW